ncbi:5-methylcytosine-specific restriction enzyme subunit McrC [Geodermatophilus telluris]|uniref:5-methylcytosine-specific restriction enzyme subunit McrC n=1 Tax=Geodermatophilus telluris TaxID=1190417 RepID=A0A1G6PFR7_9ACTN|nr:restriction endonuclease [Geodermatophilus telluris]SDC78195.1 5-methylcytosine-specific restriction enzyme subunit McrC [Geodermatophilus telluris]
MSREALQHLSEGQVLTGVDLTRAEAVALSGTKLVTATPEGDGWKVAAGQWVGAVRCGDLKVRVAPKVGAVKVLQLLARAHGVRNLHVDADQLGLADDADLSTVLAVLFEREAQTALAQRPQRGYRTEDQSLPVVRGRIRLVDQALRRFGVVTPIEVTVDEWTLDTDENRRLRAATRVLLTLPGIPKATRSGLRRVDRMLAEVTLLPRGARLPPWISTRLNRHLHRLLYLADLALGGGSVEHRVGDVVAHGFALNMAWVFEALVAQVLEEECLRSGPGRLLSQQTYALDEGERITIKPDLVVSAGSEVLAVADTKYKLLDDDGSFPNADSYQLITYALRLGLSAGHLLYAGKPLSHPGVHAIRGSDISLHIHAVDLTQALPDIERQVHEIHRRLVVACGPSAPSTGASGTPEDLLQPAGQLLSPSAFAAPK